jgi:outer membrane lipoprotein LolB
MTTLKSSTPDFRKVITTFTLLTVFFAINLIAGCAINTPATAKLDANNANLDGKPAVLSYSGRLSVRIASDPPQSLYAGFSLNGDAQTGDLTLNSPLGNSVAQLFWTPQSAVLKANNETKEYPSASALIENVTGTAIPLSALFDWLGGKNTAAEGWEIDLTGMKTENSNNDTTQRLVAKRTSPLPSAELRIALDK